MKLSFVTFSAFLVLGSLYLGQPVHSQEVEVPFVEGADPLIEEIATNEGALVQFYEADSGVLVVRSTVPEGVELDPIKVFQQNGQGKKDVGAFYEALTGKAPKGRMKQALRRHQKNKEKQEEWESPPGFVENVQSRTGTDRHADPFDRNLQQHWWVGFACKFSQPIEWCGCDTDVDRDRYYQKNSDDFYFTVTPTNNAVIYHSLEMWKCSGLIVKRDCGWRLLIDAWPVPGFRSTIWATYGSNRNFRALVDLLSAPGYHASVYDLEDTDIGCTSGGGGGCFTCQNVNIV
jgi:hypothetical protein